MDAFTRMYILSPFALILGQGHTRNVFQYPLHQMTCAPADFEVAMSNGLGGNALTRNIDHVTIMAGGRCVCVLRSL